MCMYEGRGISITSFPVLDGLFVYVCMHEPEGLELLLSQCQDGMAPDTPFALLLQWVPLNIIPTIQALFMLFYYPGKPNNTYSLHKIKVVIGASRARTSINRVSGLSLQHLLFWCVSSYDLQCCFRLLPV